MKVRIIETPAIDSTHEHHILLEGSLIVSNIEPIKRTVLEALQQHQNIRIQLCNVEILDLSVLQILYALRRAAQTESKTIHLNMHLSEELQTMVRQSGLDRKFNYMAS